jgi:hypothetical protein
MKLQRGFLMGIAILTVVLSGTIGWFIFGLGGQPASADDDPPPATAIPPTPPTPIPEDDESAFVLPPTSVPLAQPLTTTMAVLDQVLIYDQDMATWQQPWSTETYSSDPGRITISGYSSLTNEAEAWGVTEWFASDIETNAGNVWSVTILGNVQVPDIAGDLTLGGVNYVISGRTGLLLKIRPIAVGSRQP